MLNNTKPGVEAPSYNLLLEVLHDRRISHVDFVFNAVNCKVKTRFAKNLNVNIQHYCIPHIDRIIIFKHIYNNKNTAVKLYTAQQL